MHFRKAFFTAMLGLSLSGVALAQQGASPFPKGELSTTKNHTGDIWLNELNVGDATFDPSVAQAVYGPGAKLDWHIHPAGQVLLITEGTGYYQERGKPVRIVHKRRCDQVSSWRGTLARCGPEFDFRLYRRNAY